MSSSQRPHAQSKHSSTIVSVKLASMASSVTTSASVKSNDQRYNANAMTTLADRIEDDFIQYKSSACCCSLFFRIKKHGPSTHFILTQTKTIMREGKASDLDKAIHLTAMIQSRKMDYENEKHDEVNFEALEKRAVIEENPLLAKQRTETSSHRYYNTLYQIWASESYRACITLIKNAGQERAYASVLKQYTDILKHPITDSHVHEASQLQFR